MTDLCFHCGEPLPSGRALFARLKAGEQPVCCEGCRAVAELIAGIGLEDFYRYRDQPAARAELPSEDQWSAFADPQLARQYQHSEGDAQSTVLLVDGLRCAACAWLIERALRNEPGVCEVNVNAATARTRIVWRGEDSTLVSLLRRVAALGYRPHPLDADGLRQQAHDERRGMLKRLGVAGLGMMQVMMYVLPMYSHSVSEMGSEVALYLRVVGLLLTTPVLLYAGWPFLASAARIVRQRNVNMDVPVALALLLAYGASVYNTFTRQGEVYFDSVTMFIFLLTLGRYVEMLVRHRSNSVSDALVRVQPRIAHRLCADGGVQAVPVAQLSAGEHVLVRVGESVPADGVIVAGSSRLDEAWLTGESVPVTRHVGAQVMAGTVNIEAPLTVRIDAAGAATMLSGVVALMQRAQTDKPRIALAADRIASQFLWLILLAAALTGCAWWYIDPTRAFDAVLAVLVVSCPCALSLATPAVIAAACSALAKRGVLVTRADALERLAKVDVVAFDKTGTLTQGELRIGEVMLDSGLSRQHCLDLAAALEQGASHPIARAFHTAAHSVLHATELRVVPGAGVEGCINGQRYRLGHPAFALAWSQDVMTQPEDAAVVVLGSERGVLARFTLQDSVRPQAAQTVAQLHARHLATHMLSGDAAAPVRRIAQDIGIDQYAARLTPAGKLAALRQLQGEGHCVAMVGDGINDAPVLSAADVSLAMGGGTALAQAGADVILVRNELCSVPQALDIAHAARRIMRQNLYWAALYNLVGIPLAALGLVSPWVAAAGMSLSSTLVVLNALRLMNRREARTAPVAVPPTAEAHSWA